MTMPHPGSRLCRSSGVALAVVALLASLSPSALAYEATTTGKAAVALSEQRAAEAFQAYKKSDYVVAVALYLDAYEAAPSGSILYNVARIYDLKLANRSLAITFYRRYVADPGAQPDLIGVANQRLLELHDAEVASATPTDGRSSPAGATKQHVSDPPSGAHHVPQGPGNAWSASRWIGVAVGTVGLASIGVGGAFGLSAMSKARTANDLCDGNACTSQRGVDVAHAARTDAIISNIGLAGGAALLVTGAALFFLTGDREHEQGLHADLRVGTWATASEASLQLSGRW